MVVLYSSEQSKGLQKQGDFTNDYAGMKGMNSNRYLNPNEEILKNTYI